jgi:hypothetical protein
MRLALRIASCAIIQIPTYKLVGRSNRQSIFSRFLFFITNPCLKMAKDLSNSDSAAENGTVKVSDVDKIQLKNSEPGTGSQFKEFLKTVIRFSGDLSSLTCPAFFLNGLSLLEYG